MLTLVLLINQASYILNCYKTDHRTIQKMPNLKQSSETKLQTCKTLTLLPKN